MPDQRFSKVVYPSAIHSIMLTPAIAESLLVIGDTAGADSGTGVNRKIEFKEHTGHLLFDKSLITGLDSAGVPVSFRFDQITHIGFKNIGLAPKYMFPADVIAAAEQGLSHPLRKVKRGTIPYWDVVSFADDDGHIDTGTEKVVGRSKDEKPLHIDVSQVRYLEYKKFNVYKTVRFGLSTATMALFVKGFLDLAGSD